MTYRRLLVPVSPEQVLGPAFHQALAFADQQKAVVTLLTVVEDLEEIQELTKHSFTTLDLLDKATATYHQQLKEHVAVLRQQYPHVTFGTQIRMGIPFIEIIKSAAEGKADLIIIDTHRQHKQSACQWGSTTRHLMRKSPTPIWAIHHNQSKIQRVVASVDVTGEDSEGLNETILALAHEFASVNEASLYPCHAWRLETEGYLRKWNHCTDLDIALIAKELRSERSARLRNLLLPYEQLTTPVHSRLLEGDARKALPDFVRKEEIDLVIMGTLSRTGIAGFLMGNTAESMLDELQCSVITLKPKGFRSPILA